MTTFHDVWLQKLLLQTPQIWGKSLQLTGKETSPPLDLLSFQIWALYVKRYERILPLPLAGMLEILTIFKWACILWTLVNLSKSGRKFRKFLSYHERDQGSRQTPQDISFSVIHDRNGLGIIT